MPRLARCLFLLVLLLPAFIRRLPERPARACEVEGRGSGPLRWLGCASDGGSRRGLHGDERLLLGRPMDLNRATARELAYVPGLTAALAVEVIADRDRGGPFGSTEELLRVHGIGPGRLARASPFLAVEAARDGVAEGGE